MPRPLSAGRARTPAGAGRCAPRSRRPATGPGAGPRDTTRAGSTAAAVAVVSSGRVPAASRTWAATALRVSFTARWTSSRRRRARHPAGRRSRAARRPAPSWTRRPGRAGAGRSRRMPGRAPAAEAPPGCPIGGSAGPWCAALPAAAARTGASRSSASIAATSAMAAASRVASVAGANVSAVASRPIAAASGVPISSAACRTASARRLGDKGCGARRHSTNLSANSPPTAPCSAAVAASRSARGSTLATGGLAPPALDEQHVEARHAALARGLGDPQLLAGDAHDAKIGVHQRARTGRVAGAAQPVARPVVVAADDVGGDPEFVGLAPHVLYERLLALGILVARRAAAAGFRLVAVDAERGRP